MQISYRFVTLFTVLSLLSVSCQKEEMVEPSNAQINQASTTRNVTYTIDGITMHTTIRGEQNWRSFIDYMIRLAEEGHQVSFRNDNNYNCSQQSKETVVYTTNDKENANTWAADMTEQGYSVTIRYDSTTGIYTCTAVK